MKKRFALVLILITLLFLAACGGDSENHEGEAKTPSGSSAQKGRPYQDVVEDFEDNGFINIRIEPIDDLIVGWLTKDGEVEDVSVDGDKEYSSDKWYPNDVEVIITYHTFPEDSDTEQENTEIEEPLEETEKIEEQANISEEDFTFLEGKDAYEVRKILGDMGYDFVMIHDYSEMDLTSEIASYNENDQKSFIVTRIGLINYDINEVTLYVDSLSNMEEKQGKENAEKILTDKLDPFFAMDAVSQYGKVQYSYFKLHSIVGVLAQEALDENTWFFKVTCTVKDLYGDKHDMTCEAKVTGTTDNPDVISFNVY